MFSEHIEGPMVRSRSDRLVRPELAAHYIAKGEAIAGLLTAAAAVSRALRGWLLAPPSAARTEAPE